MEVCACEGGWVCMCIYRVFFGGCKSFRSARVLGIWSLGVIQCAPRSSPLHRFRGDHSPSLAYVRPPCEVPGLSKGQGHLTTCPGNLLPIDLCVLEWTNGRQNDPPGNLSWTDYRLLWGDKKTRPRLVTSVQQPSIYNPPGLTTGPLDSSNKGSSSSITPLGPTKQRTTV